MKPWIFALLAALGTMPVRASAQATAPMDEAQLRAAFVLRFAQFTQWPEAPEAGLLQLCVAGLARGEGAMQQLSNRAVGDARMRVRLLEAPGDAKGCHLLLLGHVDAATVKRWTSALGDAPVLVVGTSPEALRSGVGIALINEPQGMAFSVNASETKRRGLSLAAPVLKLAREVR
jgi:YfiR/HmsC-like